MKPTCRALLTLLQRHEGQWLSHAICYEAGGHRTTARVMELRQMGHVIEQEGAGEGSRYRLVSSPPVAPSYQRFTCFCGFGGPEPCFTHEPTRLACPSCGRTVSGQERLAV